MALQTTGAISFSQIQAEFGGSNPISLSEYYRGGANVANDPFVYQGIDSDIPASGAIRLGNFRGTTKGNIYTNYFSSVWLTVPANVRRMQVWAVGGGGGGSSGGTGGVAAGGGGGGGGYSFAQIAVTAGAAMLVTVGGGGAGGIGGYSRAGGGGGSSSFGGLIGYGGGGATGGPSGGGGNGGAGGYGNVASGGYGANGGVSRGGGGGGGAGNGYGNGGVGGLTEGQAAGSGVQGYVTLRR